LEEVIDPRLEGAKKMLSSVSRIVAVMSSKGGVGKTLLSTLLAVSASRLGFRTGLLDLDVTNPGAHIVLGIDPARTQPEEEEGILPVRVEGVEFMSTVFYTLDKPSPLRGIAIDNAIREVLVATRWGVLDLLVVDTAPGLSDVAIDTLEYLPGVEVIVVSTPSKLVVHGVEKLLSLLTETGHKRYLVENMTTGKSRGVLAGLAERYKATYLGSIGYYSDVEEYIGCINKLLNSRFGRDVESIARRLLQL